MSDTRNRPLRRMILATLFAFCASDALAQGICAQLEAEYARAGGATAASSGDPTYTQKQATYEQLVHASKQKGCVYGVRWPDGCTDLRIQIKRTVRELRKIQSQGGGQPARAGGRRDAILKALERNGCRRSADSREPRNFLTMLFGGNSESREAETGTEEPTSRRVVSGGGAYRTLCVRTCDGFYWPISYGVSSRFFERDVQACQASCPNQEVKLYVHRASGEWSNKAVSLDGTPYVKQPWAYAYRRAFKRECGCSTTGWETVVVPPPGIESAAPLEETTPKIDPEAAETAILTEDAAVPETPEPNEGESDDPAASEETPETESPPTTESAAVTTTDEPPPAPAQ